MKRRQSGMLMHISSLYGDYSIGNFGKPAFEFIDFLKDVGFSVWQVLPFTVTDSYNSPYKSYSAFGGNPFFVDPETLFAQGLLTRAELDGARQKTPYAAEYDRLHAERFALLAKASARVKDRAEIDAFLASHPHIDSFCRFMTLRAQNGEAPWQAWTTQEIMDVETLQTWQFIQYAFFTQWAKVKAYANGKGIRIIGDLPFYVSDDSCDVWEDPGLFDIGPDGRPTSVAGVPPDYFAADGQLWGNPLYNWEAMAKDDYAWWRARMDHALTLFDGVRIDHFRAVEAYWAVDAAETTARNGQWRKGPGMALVNAIKKGHEDKLIIAEDLGDITDEVRALVEESGFPGMRVFQFAFLDDGDSLHLPHNHIPNCICYSGTHDNNTLFGFLWESDEAVRRRALDYCGFPGGDWGGATPLLLRAVFASPAKLAIIPVQDFLMYGSDTRINTPGVAEGNWRYRITKEQLLRADLPYFRALHRIYKR
ncbi:MAG: 4-alpha-glucanotransferase [Clostridia bacterium]|nr:4-alpha-glucanotransferase [Clostridia bacterium]